MNVHSLGNLGFNNSLKPTGIKGGRENYILR